MRKIQYLVVCVPEKMSMRDLVEFQVRRTNPHLVWCSGYLYEYEEDWHHERPYTHHIVMVNYAPAKEYKRYAVIDQGKLSLLDKLTGIRGSAVPVLIEEAEEAHPRTQAVLNAIKSRE